LAIRRGIIGMGEARHSEKASRRLLEIDLFALPFDGCRAFRWSQYGAGGSSPDGVPPAFLRGVQNGQISEWPSRVRMILKQRNYA